MQSKIERTFFVSEIIVSELVLLNYLYEERLPCYSSKGPLKRDFLGIYLTKFSDWLSLKIQNLWRSSFASKNLKFNLHFKNAAESCRKLFSFSDNCIWIGIVKLSLLRTGYTSSAANVLRSSLKILDVNKIDFSNSIDLAVINKYDKGAVTQILKVIGNVHHAACWRVLWNGSF